MLVILDRQHFGKPAPKDNDRGVGVDLDGDSKRDAWEADLTPVYMKAAQEALEAGGHRVVLLDNGWYPTRHEDAVKIAKYTVPEYRPVAYVACHLNAGGGDYGLVLHDARSQGGARLAGHVQTAMSETFGKDELGRILVKAASTAEWKNAYYTIAGIYAGPGWLSGLCYEPVFVDTHRKLLDTAGLQRIGKALADGVIRWAEAIASGLEPDVDGLEDGALYFDDGEPMRFGLEHDARLDPMPGDIVFPTDGAGRRVVDIDEDLVIWQPFPFGGAAMEQSLKDWAGDVVGGAVIDATILRVGTVGETAGE